MLVVQVNIRLPILFSDMERIVILFSVRLKLSWDMSSGICNQVADVGGSILQTLDLWCYNQLLARPSCGIRGYRCKSQTLAIKVQTKYKTKLIPDLIINSHKQTSRL